MKTLPVKNQSKNHSMEITVYQPSILGECCDLMTSISTVSHGFLFCCIFKISQPVPKVGYSEMYRVNDN